METVLLPYQQRWIADKSPFKAAEKSRRTGFSWTEACDDALTAAASRDAGGMDAQYIGYNKEMAREFIGDCAFWALAYNLAASEMEETVLKDKDKDILCYRIKFASGFEITALSSRPSNLRGRKGKVTIDEAAFHDDLPGLLKAAMAFLMWGGRVAVISTHEGDDNPFNDLVKDIRSGKKPGSLHRVTLDDAMAEGLYKRICLTRKTEWSPEAETAWRRKLVDFYGDDADEELFCVPSRGSGIYFPGALVEACMSPDIPVLTWTCPAGFVNLPDAVREAEALAWCEETLAPVLSALPRNRRTWLGEDFGRLGALSVLIPIQESQNLVYPAVCAVELSNVPFKQQEQVLFYLVDRLPRFTGGAFDARGNGQYLAEVAMQRYGESRIRQVMLSVEWYRDHMPRYKAALEDRSLPLPRSADILQDHRAVRMDKGVARIPDGARARGSDGRQRHGDAAVAGAMAWYARTEIDGGEIEYESVDGRKAALQGAY